MITSIYGNTLEIDTALYDGDTGEFVGAEAVRLPDRQRRTYLMHQMRATGGVHELMSALESAPTKEEYGVRSDYE